MCEHVMNKFWQKATLLPPLVTPRWVNPSRSLTFTTLRCPLCTSRRLLLTHYNAFQWEIAPKISHSHNGIRATTWNLVSSAHPSLYSKLHVERASHFSTAHHILWLCFSMGQNMPPPKKKFPFPYRVHNQNGISINSAVFAGVTVVTDRQGDTPCYIGSKRSHSCTPCIPCGLTTLQIMFSRYRPYIQTGAFSAKPRD